MANIQLSYSTFGLTNLNFLDAIKAIARAGYEGVEIAFHRRQFNPFELADDDLDAVKKCCVAAGVTPACVATASHFFTPSRPHEPSLLTPDLAGRKRRIDLIKRGIRAARRLGVRLVTCGSGFIRDDSIHAPRADARERLVDSIRECLREIHGGEDMTLLIEPEPGMLVETLDDGLRLIHAVDSPHFGLHIDICHAYCSERDYIAALERAAPFARYLHISDARQGYNLKIVSDHADAAIDLDFASALVYFPDTAGYLLVDKRHPRYFGDDKPEGKRRRHIDAILSRAGVDGPLGMVDYPSLYAGASPLDDEIFTYLISVPGLSYDVLERAAPVLAYLRGVGGGAGAPPLVGRMLANTLTGIAHFHEIPGEGTLDLAASARALESGGFHGYGSVELYHHVESWERALSDSHRHLAALATGPL
ncbi:MAG: sugar phosphate isomerase/epimerase [Candidimonas sp.]|nr:MAG: sugar phosphate isomerase/epimerase [Candidimonas sp.]